VAIIAHRSASLPLAVLGVLKAGTAFVMIDPAYPAERIVTILEASGARAVVRVAAGPVLEPPITAWLANANLRARVELPRKVGIGDVLDAYPTSTPTIGLTADDLAYVGFTSGSTGKPKGVRGAHGSLTHFHPWVCREFGLTIDDRFTMLAGLAHDPLHRDLFTPFQLGASVHILATEEITIPGRLASWMAAERVSVAHLTPAFGQLITDSAEEGIRIESLRRTFMTGDVLTRRDVDRLRNVAPNVSDHHGR
jgi:non-ribosomal peptide synthetase component F